MLGAIIGDIVGSRYEFNPTNDYNFEMFADGSGFTDDTICTIAVADAILRGKPYGESIHEWCRKYPYPKGGYGGRFRQWVMSDSPKPYGSFGNGSAMRVSPIGWWYDNAEDLIGEARKSAECTHNHEYGIEGAIAVVAAIADCRRLRRERDVKKLTPKEILEEGLPHATYQYVQFTDQFHVDIEAARNKFDETCQGTVPVALWIVMHSTGFEDAIRRAVSLGADADTLGAIVGSIAEALWGIPEWMKKKAMSYLPAEMQNVVREFNRQLNVRRKLSNMCEYFRVGDYSYPAKMHVPAYEIEKEWVNDLAKSYRNADVIKDEMVKLCRMRYWQGWADEYELPVSLIGYIFRRTADYGSYMRERAEPFETFLRANYSDRKKRIERQREVKAKLDQY